MNEITTINPQPMTPAEQVREFQRLADARNTRRAYWYDYAQFTAWAVARGYAIFPKVPETDPQVVAEFIADQARSGKSASTVERRISAIAWVHKRSRARSPIDDAVRETMRGIRRTIGAPPAFKRPLLVEHVRQIADVMPHGEFRDRAIILFGFASAMRREELAELRPEDLQLRQEGYLVTIPRSKTDQNGEGVTIKVPRGKEMRYCPVQAVEELLLFTGGAQPRLFGLRDGQWIALVVKKWVAAIGLNPEEYSAHSLRSGWITSAEMTRAPLFRIMEHSRHKDYNTARQYFHSDSFRDHPGNGLL